MKSVRRIYDTREQAIKMKRDAKSRIKRSGQGQLVYVKRHKSQYPHDVKVSQQDQAPARPLPCFHGLQEGL